LKKRLLGIDYGSVRVGIAVSDPLGIIARGVKVLKNSHSMMGEIKKLVDEYDIGTIIVGYPYTLKGTRGMKGQEVDAFTDLLRREVSCPVVTLDERFSSKSAAQTLRMMGVHKKERERKGVLDEMAAALILQAYLDSQKVVRDELS
jgi:putative Holliday junction resolvase